MTRRTKYPTQRSLRGLDFAKVSARPRPSRVAVLLHEVEALSLSIARFHRLVIRRPRTQPESSAPAVDRSAAEPLPASAPPIAGRRKGQKTLASAPVATVVPPSEATSLGRRFLSRNMRRLRVASLPLALGAALLCFAHATAAVRDDRLE